MTAKAARLVFVFEVHLGDCLEVLRGMPDNSVDSIVTDPPYGLSFMGKKWDYDVPSVEIWAECLRVLKPGGHLLAFAGTRTQHRMAVRIEDAGFEIRDMIAWVYGSGFPKSLDVSKALDKVRIEDVEPIRVVCRAVRAAMDAKGLKSRDLTQHFGDCHPRLIDHWAARDTDSQPSLPTWEQWGTLRDLLEMGDELDAEVWRLNGRKGKPGDNWQNAEVVGEETLPDTSIVRAGFVGMTAPDGKTPMRTVEIKAANSDAARQWQGWGTALKPSLEPVTVARKPLSGTVAENVLRHGTGALNIDGCRVGNSKNVPASLSRTENAVYGKGLGGHAQDGTESGHNPNIGRWPANLIHDGSEEVLAAFPGEQDGSAARFFYCPKASKRDRDEGLDGFAQSTPGQMTDREDGSAGLNNPRAGAGRTGGGKNIHPTVKPTELMAYLCRLVTPPGGVVLDPFMGSGSTGKAAMREGFRFIGIERDPQYIAIAQARIGYEIAGDLV